LFALHANSIWLLNTIFNTDCHFLGDEISIQGLSVSTVAMVMILYKRQLSVWKERN